jgi:hypothetical protein
MGRRKIEIEPITVSGSSPLAPSVSPLLFSSVLVDDKGPLVCSQHERNRSVTFLKASSRFCYFCDKKVLAVAYFRTTSFQRKNGLFKKAYELGVLCSVDVAVIIFGRYRPPALVLYPNSSAATYSSIYISQRNALDTMSSCTNIAQETLTR